MSVFESSFEWCDYCLCIFMRSLDKSPATKCNLLFDTEEVLMTTKQAIDDKSGLTMTVNTGRLRQEINNLLILVSNSDH